MGTTTSSLITPSIIPTTSPQSSMITPILSRLTTNSTLRLTSLKVMTSLLSLTINRARNNL